MIILKKYMKILLDTNCDKFIPQKESDYMHTHLHLIYILFMTMPYSLIQGHIP